MRFPAQEGSSTGVNHQDSTVEHRAALALLACFAVVFILQLGPRITAPFGDSHDGRNGGVWGMAARAVRTHGIVKSRIGARLETPEGTTRIYAHHPPLITVETAALQAVFGESHLATRGPAWIGSLAVIALVYAIARNCGARPLMAACGTVFGLGTRMFFVFGGMLDTPVVGLPVALAVVLAWQRVTTRHDTRLWPLAAATVFAVLAAWEAVLVVAVLLVFSARRRDRRTLAALAASACSALALALAWIAWSSGSLRGIAEAFATRAGVGARHPSAMAVLRAQGLYLSDLVPATVLVLGPIGAIAALRRPTSRPAVVATLGTPVAYCALLPDGAYFHAYWGYWVIAGLAVSVAVGTEALVEFLRDRVSRPGMIPYVLVTGAFAAGVLAGLAPSAARLDFERGAATGRLVHLLRTDGRCTPVATPTVAPDTWIWYETGAPPCPVRHPPPPGTRVLVALAQLRSGPSWIRHARVLGRAEPYAVVEVRHG
ncbi:MAG: hypothetical protein C4321_03345 [Chloroflexota bacterium]